MDLLEKWMQNDQLQDPDNIDALLEAADLTRQFIMDRDYEGINKNIYLVTSENFDTKDNDYIEYRLLFRR